MMVLEGAENGNSSENNPQTPVNDCIDGYETLITQRYTLNSLASGCFQGFLKKNM